jgi:hypothetical protein
MATLKKQWQDELQQANQNLQALNAQQPAAFSSENTALKNAALDAINNRQKFSYDVNADALYQQYKDKYLNLGKLAMQDTVGKTSALTGGYGNSYAQNAGQQAYQQYVTQLNDKIPELYSLAYSQYQDEGNDLKDRYKLYAQQEADDYDRYRDTVNDYNVNRNYWQGVGENAQNGLYKLSRDAVNDAADLRNYNLKLGLDSKGNPINVSTGDNVNNVAKDSGLSVSDTTKIMEQLDAREGDIDAQIKALSSYDLPEQNLVRFATSYFGNNPATLEKFLTRYFGLKTEDQINALLDSYPFLADYFMSEEEDDWEDPYVENPEKKKLYKAGGGRRETAMISLKD